MGRQISARAIAAVLRIGILAWLFVACPAAAQKSKAPMLAVDKSTADEPGSESPAVRESSTKAESLRGRVVWMAEALELRGARSVPEARQRILALRTGSDELIPILEDVRGQSLRLDDRLRAIDLELLVRKLPRTAVIQIISMYEVTSQGKFELDYWCEVCAIAMYELKPCDCCQGVTELRKRRVAETRPKSP